MPARLSGSQLQDALVGGDPRWLGRIVATTTKNNHDTATPFNNTGEALKGKTLLLVASAACHFRTGDTNAVTVATTNGEPLAANEKRAIAMPSDRGWIAVVGTANVDVFELV